MGNRRLLVLAGFALLIAAVVLFLRTRDKDDKPPLHSVVTYDAAPAFVALDATPAPIDASIDATVDATIDAESSARQEREALLASLRDSGPGHEAWEAQATELFASVADRDTLVAAGGCFIAGCGATFTFSSQATYQRKIDQLQASALYAAWTGGKKLSPPETRNDGRVIVALVLYRPD